MKPSAPRDPREILFLGSLDWRPNLDALALFLDRIFPAVRLAEPSARLTIVGRTPSAALERRVSETEGAELIANVPDVRPYLARAGVLTVPLRIGGGSRLKILEALATGLAVVSTTVGAEGLDLKNGEHLDIVDDPVAFASRLVETIRSPIRAQAMAEHGRRLVLERYDWDALAKLLERELGACSWANPTGSRRFHEHRRISTMTVVHLAASAFVGGPESQMLGVIGHWPGRSAVLSFSEGGRCRALLDEARRLGAEAVELNSNAPAYRASVREVAEHLRRVDASVLCCHGYKPDLLGMLAAKSAGVPVVSISHGWTAATLKVRLNEALDRLCLHAMDRVVCVSEGQGRRVRKAGVSLRKIAVIRNAVDPSKYGQTSLDRESLLSLFPDGDRPARIVGAAGRLSPEKGYCVLVERRGHRLA